MTTLYESKMNLTNTYYKNTLNIFVYYRLNRLTNQQVASICLNFGVFRPQIGKIWMFS